MSDAIPSGAEISRRANAAKRELVYVNGRNEPKRVVGESVRLISAVGVHLFLAGRTRVIIPWQRVVEFQYDAFDTEMKSMADKLL